MNRCSNRGFIWKGVFPVSLVLGIFVLFSEQQRFLSSVTETGEGLWLPHLCPHRSKQSRWTLEWKSPTPNTIYFTQTSCSNVLNAREVCAVESASLHHPQRPVILLLTSPHPNYTHPYLKVLQGLSNVRLAWLDLDQVFENEKLQEWHQSRQWMYSQGRTSAEVSDAVRAELLRRFGGTYVDLDAITLQPFPNTSNWIARTDDRLVNAAVASFNPGHPLLQAVVDAIPESFNPQDCCSIGPNLFTSMLNQLCPTNVTIPSSARQDQAEFCNGVTVFPRKLFYPIHYGYRDNELKSIFREGEGLGLSFLSKTKAFSLHLFHSLSKKRRVSVDGDSILKEVAQRNCPMLFQSVKARNEML